ncbi:hypothetical protein [Nocardioides speluncae]|uniref:hypothetical protein n=1 Tax=Nocardioides speluncae TaxID=2670337 RepID=UPI000D69A079|nr:hypothetical protein [Nocardioides speluncae]
MRTNSRKTLTTLAAGLLVLALAGCGEEEPTTANEPSSTPSTSSSPGSPDTTDPTDAATSDAGQDGPVDFELVEIVSATEGGGTVTTTPTQLGGAGKVDAFVAKLNGPELPQEVRSTVKGVRPAPDEGLFAAVVAIGCDVPHDITLERAAGKLVVKPVIKKTGIECFAPVTSVAVFTAPTGT